MESLDGVVSSDSHCEFTVNSVLNLQCEIHNVESTMWIRRGDSEELIGCQSKRLIASRYILTASDDAGSLYAKLLILKTLLEWIRPIRTVSEMDFPVGRSS